MKAFPLYLIIVALVAGCLAKSGTGTDLRSRLNSSDPKVRYRAVSELMPVEGDEATSLLIAATADPDLKVRVQAVTILGRRRSTAATDRLIDLLHDNDGRIRCEAARSLGEIGEEKAIMPLIDLMQYEYALAQEPKASNLESAWRADAVADVTLSALNDITHTNFAFDVSKWNAWYGAKYKRGQ